MLNIIINTCGQTPNYDAVEAVAKFMLKNRQQDYSYDREVTVLSGRVLAVSERHTDEDKNGCDCSFQVTRKK